MEEQIGLLDVERLKLLYRPVKPTHCGEPLSKPLQAARTFHFWFSANKESGVADSCEKGTSNRTIASTRYAILTQDVPISSVKQG
jgi:hypothetical protein